jgi:hypothetical protein
MAEPKRVEVELSDFLTDLDPVAMKGLASAAIAYRADRLIETIPRRYGYVTHGELVSAILHGTPPNEATLAEMIETYREDRVFHTRRALGELSPDRGLWEIEIRGSGGRKPS